MRCFGGPGEVLVGCLKIVLRSNGLGVTDPVTDHMNWELFRQLGFTRAAKILEQLWPWFQIGLTNDPFQLCPQVAVAIAIAGDDRRTQRRIAAQVHFVSDLLQFKAEFGEQRNSTKFFALVMLGFR